MRESPSEVAASIVREFTRKPCNKRQRKLTAWLERAIAAAIRRACDETACELERATLWPLLNECTNFDTEPVANEVVGDVFGVHGLNLPAKQVAQILLAIIGKIGANIGVKSV